jgi:nucleotide-binding universal stress UspA family protein
MERVMYRSLLVPLDGSTFGEHALPLALSIARRAGSTLNVVQVHEPLTPMYADSIAPGTYEAEVKVLEQERAYLDGIVKRLASVSSVRVTSTLLEGPLIAETLNGHAGSTGADLIVMTTHGRGPLSRFWLGSVADETIRRATLPILLVRPQETAPDFTVEQVLRHILIPLDGSVLAEQVLEAAVALGGLMQSHYTLVRIYGPLVDAGRDSLRYATAGGSEPPTEQLRAEAQDYLNPVAERLKVRGSSVQTHVALGQHAASDILDAAQRLGVDLMALETHGRRGLARLLMGSVADKVIRGASMPVLVHRSAGKGTR